MQTNGLNEHESALKTLLDKIESINNGQYEGTDSMIEVKKNDDTIAAIENFYLPNNRDELIELALFMKQQSEKDTSFSGSLDGFEIAIVKAYRVKYKELREKLRQLFPGDKQIISLIGAEEPAPEKKKGFFARLFG